MQEVPPRRRKSPRTAPPPTFSYSLTLRPAAAPTRSDPHPHSMSPDCSISHPSSPDVPRPQHLPPYSLTLRTAATPTRSDSHPAAAPNFFLMNLLNTLNSKFFSIEFLLIPFWIYTGRVYKCRHLNSSVFGTFPCFILVVFLSGFD